MGIVILCALIPTLGAALIVFHPAVQEYLVKSSAANALSIGLCAASIYWFYLVAKRMPRYKLGLGFLSGYLVILLIYIISALVADIDSIWVGRIHYLLLILLPLSTSIILWQSIRNSREDKVHRLKIDS